MLDYKISVIVNLEGSSSNFAKGIYNYMKKRAGEDDEDDKVELNPLEIRYFDDGEFKPKITKNVRRRNCVFVHDSNLEPSIWSKQLSLVNQALRYSSPHEIINVAPYWRWARQDRKDESRVPISAKDDGEHIDKDHTRVLTVEVHNEAMQGFFDIPFDNLPFFPALYEYLSLNYPEILKDLVFVGPDAGSVNRNRRFTKILGMDVAEIDKYRTVEGSLGKTLGILGAEIVRGRNVLLYDDLCSTGTSLETGADALRNAKAKKVYGAIPHGLFVEGMEKVVKHFDLFFLGNTINQPLVPGEGVLLPKYVRQDLQEEIKTKLPDRKNIFFSDVLKLLKPYKEFTLPENVKIVNLESLIGEASFNICVGDSFSKLFDLSLNN